MAERSQAVATLCAVAGLINCACIWIRRSSRLLFATLAPPADAFEPADELGSCDGAALACMSNSVCRVCAPNCGAEPPAAGAPLVEDDATPPVDAVVPWPSVANSDAMGSDCALPPAVESGCNSDCHSAEGLWAFDPLTGNDMSYSCTRYAKSKRVLKARCKTGALSQTFEKQGFFLQAAARNRSESAAAPRSPASFAGPPPIALPVRTWCVKRTLLWKI